MARLRVSYSDRRNGCRASVAVEVDLDAVTVADPERLARLIRDQQTYVRLAVLDELQRATGRPPRTHAHTEEPTGPAPDHGDAWEPPVTFDEFTGPPPAASPTPTRRGRRRAAEPGEYAAQRPPHDDQDPDDDSPADGRQLLGWARKQDPDAIGLILSFGKRNGYASKVVNWTPEEVRKAYQFTRGVQRAAGQQ
jgi:hypothetical protein